MDGQIDKALPQPNKWANTSIWIGVCALLPYLVRGVTYYFQTGMTGGIIFFFELIAFSVCYFWGIVFGLAGLVTGIRAIKQTYSRQRTLKGIFSSFLGVILGIAAIMSNVVFYLSLLINAMG